MNAFFRSMGGADKARKIYMGKIEQYESPGWWVVDGCVGGKGWVMGMVEDG